MRAWFDNNNSIKGNNDKSHLLLSTEAAVVANTNEDVIFKTKVLLAL